MGVFASGQYESADTAEQKHYMLGVVLKFFYRGIVHRITPQTCARQRSALS